MKGSYFKRKPKVPMKRTKLRVKGTSTTAQLKEAIQAKLREGVIKRDSGCILRHYKEAGSCGGRRTDGELILQAEHLVTRSRTATFGDLRNIVCLCKYHHLFFKKQHSSLYWDLIRKHIGEERYAWFQRARDDSKTYKVDLKLTLIGLTQEVKELSTLA
jgi:hypothetical protein